MDLGTKFGLDRVINNFFTKNDTKYVFAPTGQKVYHKKQNWQVNNLNIEPPTFCGLIEIKETVTE